MFSLKEHVELIHAPQSIELVPPETNSKAATKREGRDRGRKRKKGGGKTEMVSSAYFRF